MPGRTEYSGSPGVARLGLPTNIDGERFLLAAGMRNEDNLARIVSVINPEDYSNEINRMVCRAQYALHEQGITVDLLTVTNYLQNAGQLESVGGMSYIASLEDGLTGILDLDPEILSVKHKSILRRTIFAIRKLEDECSENSDSAVVLENAQRVITALSAEQADRCRPRTVEEIVIDAGGANEFWTPRNFDAIATPWARLNSILGGGVRSGELVVIAGRPGVGKSSMGCNIAEHAVSHGVGTVVYSLEMSASEILKRIACSWEIWMRRRFEGKCFPRLTVAD